MRMRIVTALLAIAFVASSALMVGLYQSDRRTERRLRLLQTHAQLESQAALAHRQQVEVALEKLEKDSAALSGSLDELPQRIDAALAGAFDQRELSGSGVARERVLAMFDGIDIYQKNGLVEMYGLSLRPRYSGPVELRSTELHLEGPRAFAIWTPDHGAAAGARTVNVKLQASLPTTAALRVGIVAADGRSAVFTAGPATSGTAPLPAGFPDSIAAIANNAALHSKLTSRGAGKWTAELPVELADSIHHGNAIRHVYLEVEGAAGQVVAVEMLALEKRGAHQPSPAPGAVLAGRVTGGPARPGAIVTLLSESGAAVETETNGEGRYSFADIPRGKPISLRFRHEAQDYYAGLGRWFVIDGDRDDVDIDLRPRYLNTSGKQADVKDARINPDYASEFGDVFAKHTRQRWTGSGGLQEYDNLTFSNNIGQLDRDRFESNPDSCFRVVHLGSSHTVALQTRVFEKTNILMESELSVKLQHCVEVFSVGLNNGELAAGHPLLFSLFSRYKFNILLFEHGSYVMSNFDPELYRRGFGFDPVYRHLPHFERNSEGKLVSRALSKQAVLHARPVDHSEIVPGVPFADTLRLPAEHQPAAAKSAYRNFASVIELVQSKLPSATLVMHTGLDQAQCHGVCDRQAQLGDVGKVPYGASVFLRNMLTVCADTKIHCINPVVPAGVNTEAANYLHFVDSHFNIRGHQWLAHELSAGVSRLLGRQ